MEEIGGGDDDNSSSSNILKSTIVDIPSELQGSDGYGSSPRNSLIQTANGTSSRTPSRSPSRDNQQQNGYTPYSDSELLCPMRSSRGSRDEEDVDDFDDRSLLSLPSMEDSEEDDDVPDMAGNHFNGIPGKVLTVFVPKK